MNTEQRRKNIFTYTFIRHRFKGIAKLFQGVINLEISSNRLRNVLQILAATFMTSWQVTKVYETLDCDKILTNK